MAPYKSGFVCKIALLALVYSHGSLAIPSIFMFLVDQPTQLFQIFTQSTSSIRIHSSVKLDQYYLPVHYSVQCLVSSVLFFTMNRQTILARRNRAEQWKSCCEFKIFTHFQYCGNFQFFHEAQANIVRRFILPTQNRGMAKQQLKNSLFFKRTSFHKNVG